MVQKVKLLYYNDALQIALANWKIVYQLKPSEKRLYPEVVRGKLVYRAKGSAKRISYAAIKKGLIPKITIIKEEVPNWL